MFGLRSVVQVAEEMGQGLGASEVLQRKVSPSAKNVREQMNCINRDRFDIFLSVLDDCVSWKHRQKTVRSDVVRLHSDVNIPFRVGLRRTAVRLAVLWLLCPHLGVAVG